MTLDEHTLNNTLEEAASDLDISPTDYRRAVEAYTAVGNWLTDGFSEAFPQSVAEPVVFPQGSMRLGTVVRPLRANLEADYDIDLVCELQADKGEVTPSDVKHQVGDRLRDNATYAAMLGEESKRCWVLNYAPRDGVGFHIDVLPCVPEPPASKQILLTDGVAPEHVQSAIAITNKDSSTYEWSSSNPEGYARWFESKNASAFLRAQASQKRALFERHRAIYASVDKVPDQMVRTPLQRAIQLLKRHRDVRFSESTKHQPISMIITTLAAELYENEPDVYSALHNIVTKLALHADLMHDRHAPLEERVARLNLISRRRDGTWYIPNPVNRAENFADRWHEDNHARARAFFRWVGWVKEDLIDRLGAERTRGGAERLAKGAMGLIVPTVIVPRRGSGEVAVPPKIGIDNPSKPWGA